MLSPILSALLLVHTIHSLSSVLFSSFIVSEMCGEIPVVTLYHNVALDIFVCLLQWVLYDKSRIWYVLRLLWICTTSSVLWGDKVSMLTHIYPHKPQRKIEVTICKITRLTTHFMCGLMSDLLICKFIKTYGHTWHRMSLLRPGVIKPHKTKPNQSSVLWNESTELKLLVVLSNGICKSTPFMGRLSWEHNSNTLDYTALWLCFITLWGSQ